ncbi:alpha/beta-Hydrolases superfamily protein [Wolffia australiana]
MASLGGILHRPLSAATAVAIAAVSSDLPEIFTQTRSIDSAFDSPAPEETTSGYAENLPSSWVPHISLSNLSFNYPSKLSSRSQDLSQQFHDQPSNLSKLVRPKSLFTSFPPSFAATRPVLNLNHNTNLSSEEVSYRWHLPNPLSHIEKDKMGSRKIRSQTVVVILGWLGAKQKHLKKYAEWYTSRGFHVVTFTLPMDQIISYNVVDKTQQEIGDLSRHLAESVAEEEGHGKNLIFHTFSNTGWIMYGVILENFLKQDPSMADKIKCCIVDSAPVAAPDPQVWASGFSAAMLKKQSSVTGSSSEPSVREAILLQFLERVFKVVLNLPTVNKRLEDVFEVLSSKQPRCPQLYVYSSSDRVIPASSVESFMAAQRKAGHQVRAHNFISSPHVDHFRAHPSLYDSHLTSFLDDYVLSCAKSQST